jgi:3-hydroxymyristoyl/3-hydroxydecanoyl-(acyl carrier protein) dehydratase
MMLQATRAIVRLLPPTLDRWAQSRRCGFLMPVVPGDRMDIDAKILKLAGDVALVEGTVALGETAAAARGRIAFVRRTFE